jgi:hypothetical protein
MTEEVKQQRWVREHYPWASLENSGDSFVVPEDKRKTGRQLVFAANKKAGGGVYRFESGSGSVVRV